MPTNIILNLYWSPDSSELFIPLDGDGTWLWRPKAADSVLERFEADIDFMDFSDDGAYLYFTHAGDFHIWHTQPYHPLHQVALPFPEYTALLPMATTRADRVLVMGLYNIIDDPGATGKLWLFNVNSATIVFQMEHSRSLVTHGLNADGHTLFYSDDIDTVFVRDTTDATVPIRTWKSAWLDEAKGWSGCNFRWQGDNIVGYCDTATPLGEPIHYGAAVWNPNTDSEVGFDFADIGAMHDHFGWATDEIRVNMLNPTDEPHVQVWNPVSKQVYMEFDIDAYGSPAVALSPDGTLLARIEDETITLYEVQTGNLVREIELDF